MAGAEISLTYDDCPDDLTDEGFEQGDCSSSSSPLLPDVPLSLSLHIQKYAHSAELFDRQRVPGIVQDMFRNAPADVLSKELSNIMREFIKVGEESALRPDLLEQIPDIAADAIENSSRAGALKDVIGDYLIPLVVRNLGASETGVDKAAQSALIQLVERGYVSKFEAEIKICPSILALSKMESQLDINTGAITLMSKLASMLGKDITERIFLKRFTELCSSHTFYVRKISAAHIGHFCAVVGKAAFEKNLLPCYLALCQDEIWGVRKSCAEVIMFVSCVCPSELRKTLLAPASIKLLHDECRWVRMSAFQTLGAFIGTFASPPLTSIQYNNAGVLVLVNQNGDEFQPCGVEGFINTSITVKEELSFFNIKDSNFFGMEDEKNRKDDKEITDLDDSKCTDNSKNSIANLSQDLKNEIVLVTNQNLQQTEQVSMKPTHSIKTDNNNIKGDTTMFISSCSNEYKENLTSLNSVFEQEDKKHEDDLLYYNEYNYWYISPPNIEIDGTIEINNTVNQEGEAATSVEIMTSQLEDLYATINLNDSSDNFNNSILSFGDKKGDNVVCENKDVNIVTNLKAEPKEPLQNIVPQELIDNFVSMAHFENNFNDNDMSFYCAYALPAVVLTLGKDNWNLLKDTVQTLAGHMSYKIRRTVASCLHEIALILGPGLASEDLTPLFEGFLKDLDEVRIGILKHLAQFLQLINIEKRIIILPKLTEFLRIDNVCNWRFQETLAEQLTQAVKLYEPADIVKHIGLYAQALMWYNVAAVRQAAIYLVTEIVKIIASEHGLASSYLVVIAERFAHSKKWKPRQTFALLCSELLQQRALDSEEFASVLWPHLLDLSWDPVANVKIVVAKCIVKHIITNEYFMEEHLESLENVLRRLQADKDRDVRLSAGYKSY